MFAYLNQNGKLFSWPINGKAFDSVLLKQSSAGP